MAFVSDFKKCFQFALEPYGFKKMKGTNYFGKLINNEILLYISFKNRSAIQHGNKAFSILTGVQTIYSYNLSINQLENSGISLINYRLDDSCVEVKDIFEYQPNDISSTLKEALDQTLTIAIPELLKVKDLNSCVEFLSKYRIDLLQLSNQIYRDSVLLIITNNHDSFDSAFEQAQKAILKAFGYNEYDPNYISAIKEINQRITNDLIKSRDMVWGDKKLQNEIFREVEKRRDNNIVILEGYDLL